MEAFVNYPELKNEAVSLRMKRNRKTGTRAEGRLRSALHRKVARITSFRRIAKDRVNRHSDVECGYSFVTYEGKPAVVLETYGSSDRAIPGKTSQSLLLDKAGAARLVAILNKVK